MTNDSVVDALFTNGGVVRVRTLEELIDVTSFFNSQPVPNGNRLAIVGNAGGPLILAADAAEASGLAVPVLSGGLQQRIREAVADAAATANPVDLLATVTGEQLNGVLDVLGASNAVDAVVVVTVPVRVGSVSLGVSAQGAGLGLPVIVAEMGESSERAAPGSFPAPERAIHALSRVVAYGDWRRELRERSEATLPTPSPVDVSAAQAIIQAAAASGNEWLSPEDAYGVLVAIGVTVAPYRFVQQLRIAPLLAGYRDHAAVDLPKLADLVARVGVLINDVPELSELDLNPVIATAEGIAAVDVRMRLRRVDGAAEPIRGLRNSPRISQAPASVGSGSEGRK